MYNKRDRISGRMEKTTYLIIDESDQDREALTKLINSLTTMELTESTNSFKNGLALVNQLEPNILFIAVKGDGANAFNFLEKLKKQPTIIFLADTDYAKTFETNKLNYITKPVKSKDLEAVLSNINKNHQQIANKMQGLMGKLKFEE